MFKIKVADECSITVIGDCIDPQTSIELAPGWSWIAYLPASCMPVEEAMESILPGPYGNCPDDCFYQVKGQTASKTLVPEIGPIGDMKTMCDGQGYMIKLDESCEQPWPLLYP